MDKKVGRKSTPKVSRKFKLLLVEDDEHIQTILFKSLMDTDHFFIDLVYDGAMVMEEVINNTYDLILMDVNLPNVSGDQITRLIRDFPFKNIKKIPIIGITANAFEDDMKEYKKIGMNAVLIKPFEEKALIQTIFKLLK
jgi:CheY-like chemotaxis protein